MENASKALIIAGAILLSILIIALGMRIYNSASSSAEGADLSAQEVSAHNSQIEAYTGRQKGSQVVTLINAIQKNNIEYEDRGITVSFSNTTAKQDMASSANHNWNLSEPGAYLKIDGVNQDGTSGLNCRGKFSNEAHKTKFLAAYSKMRETVLPNVTYQVDAYYHKSGIIHSIDIYLPK